MTSSARNSTDKDPELELALTTSGPQSLSKAVHARKSEYTRPQRIKVKIGSWNVAACPGTDKDLAGWFVDGKGIDKRLAGLDIGDPAKDDGSKGVEGVDAQEYRRSKKLPTIPHGDIGVVAGGEEIGLYVLGLQEVVELTSAKEYIGKVYNDLGPITKWRTALTKAVPPGYKLVAEQQLSGLLMLIFASPAIAPTISSVSNVSVGTGIMGYLGNKGAVITRIVLGETTRLVFINSHLASGNEPAQLERRCWDVAQILQRTRFDPISWGGVLEDAREEIGEEDFAFWFGDLNFRLDGLPGEDIRRLLMLHTRGEYAIGHKGRKKLDSEIEEYDEPIFIHSVDSDDEESDDSTGRTSSSLDHGDDESSATLPDPDDFIQDPSQDPASLQATLDSLLPHDQLRHVQKHKRVFHDGWREGPITFLPTYKYDVGSMGMFDSSEKRRAPSWCDRILYRTRKDKTEYDGRSQEEELARLKDAEMEARGIDRAGDDENVLFEYNADDDGSTDGPTSSNDYDEYNDGQDGYREEIVTKEGYVDRIHLDVYTSHQRVLSSDHKPLDAVFTLEYDAVDPALKAKIHQEVAWALDRAENEGRPGITVLIDHSQDTENTSQADETSSIRPSIGGTEGVDFGDVSFQSRKRCGLTIANTSQVTSTFAFVDRPSESGEEDHIAPSWLSVSFVDFGIADEEQNVKDMRRAITLEPGDSVNATIEMFIDDVALVRSLNSNSIHLDDVLVLRVTDGRDHFIPIRGTWLQSCFGRSIDELIRIPEGGVRALRPRSNDPTGGPVNRGQEVCWSAPRELFKLTEAVEALTERTIADAAMLDHAQFPQEISGWPFSPKSWLLTDVSVREALKSHVLNALDADKALNESFPAETPAIDRLEIMGEVLVLFLESITDGIITAPLWTALENDLNARGIKILNPDTDFEDTKAWVLDILSVSPNHNISFVFLTAMLSRVAGELAPVPKSARRDGTANAVRSSMDAIRMSISWTGNKAPSPSDPAVLRRKSVERSFAEVFAGVIFKPSAVGGKERERRVTEDKRRNILEAFLRARED